MMHTGVVTLTEFLLARIAEDEAVARAVADENLGNSNEPVGTGDDPWPAERVFAERFTPARVLAECERDRRLVEWANVDDWTDPNFASCGAPGEDHGEVLAWLAEVYADHPDYDEEWRP